ncbi:MAG: DUF4194 domain-containing protein [Planctomycetaceae bacterium]|nr:DUF4194 domain-containing protein [Planctomycetaceae bacterium]
MTGAGDLETIQLSQAVVPLLKGVVYRDDMPEFWRAILAVQARAADYVAVLGLRLIVNEAEGYAFLQGADLAKEEDGEDGSVKRPRLVVRRPLTFPVSLLLALLRKRLAESDRGGGDTRLVLTSEEITEMMRLFLIRPDNEFVSDTSYDAKILGQVQTLIGKVVELGFLRELKGQDNHYEVRRVLKDFIDAQWLGLFEDRLAAYQKHLEASTEQ